MTPNKIPPPVKVIQKNVAPTVLANQFLYHEFLKIFRDVRSPTFRRQIKLSVNSFLKRDGQHHYWLLVAALAEGWRVKQVYRLLTDTSYQWNLEIRKISDLTMTGFNPAEVDRIIFRSRRNFYTFADYYHRHPDFFRKYMPNLKPRPERDHHPVFVYWDKREKQLRLFDGMRRTTLAAISGKKRIRAFIGYPIRPGKPMINLDKIQFFKLLAAQAKKDKKTIQAFIIVGREIVEQHQNARRDFKKALKPWSDDFSKKLTHAITKK